MSITEARQILNEWKGDSYIFGVDVLNKIGKLAKKFGPSTLIVSSNSSWTENSIENIIELLEKENLSYYRVLGSRPNCPREDVYRLTTNILKIKPDSIIAFGGGSTIDCAKAASILSTYNSIEVRGNFNVGWDESCTIDPYFGTGMVRKIKDATNKDPKPIIAVQTASGSAAHLTKYSNITDPITAQKKLIVDESIVPKYAIFDYQITISTPKSLTVDGGLDGISHLWEVFMGATGKNNYKMIKKIAKVGIYLIVNNLKRAVEDSNNIEAKTAIGLGTDLGGYAIMLGGTNGPHLGSFSLVDVLTHGRACAILNPYYTVFFSPKIQDQLQTVASIFKEDGFIKEDLEGVEGRDLSQKLAEGMIEFNKSLGFPTTLKEAGVTEKHIVKMLEAAKDPQLKMKLLNMPIPLDPDKGDIENYMKAVLDAAFTGDISLINTNK